MKEKDKSLNNNKSIKKKIKIKHTKINFLSKINKEMVFYSVLVLFFIFSFPCSNIYLNRKTHNKKINEPINLSKIKLKEHDDNYINEKKQIKPLKTQEFVEEKQPKPKTIKKHLQSKKIAKTRKKYTFKDAQESIYENKKLTAISILRKLEKQNPNDIKSIKLLSELYYNLGYIREAVTYYKKTLNLTNNKELYFKIGICYYHFLKDNKNAIKYFKTYIKKNGKYSSTALNILRKL